MRPWMAAAALLALLVSPTEAQMGRHHRGDDSARTDQKKTRADEGLQGALKRIPEPKEKYDPWSGARPSDQKAKVIAKS
jgi:hypothetical protein